MAPKYGARVVAMDENVIMVYQTVKKGEAQNAPYVTDQPLREAFVSISDDKAIADAVRAALRGRLKSISLPQQH